MYFLPLYLLWTLGADLCLSPELWAALLHPTTCSPLADPFHEAGTANDVAADNQLITPDSAFIHSDLIPGLLSHHFSSSLDFFPPISLFWLQGSFWFWISTFRLLERKQHFYQSLHKVKDIGAGQAPTGRLSKMQWVGQENQCLQTIQDLAWHDAVVSQRKNQPYGNNLKILMMIFSQH